MLTATEVALAEQDPSDEEPPATAAAYPVRRPFRAPGRATLGLLLTPLLLGGCFFKTTFSDMSARLDALEIAERYERVGERRSGTKPDFFGDSPKVTRSYLSPDDVAKTCAELEGQFADYSPRTVRLADRCYLHFGIRSGARAMAFANFRYQVQISVLSFDDRPDSVVKRDRERPRAMTGVRPRRPGKHRRENRSHRSRAVTELLPMSRSRSRTGPSRGMPPAKAAVDPSVRKLFSASGRATLGLLLTPLLLGGCFFTTTFSDMSARLDALEIPERWERALSEDLEPTVSGRCPLLPAATRFPSVRAVQPAAPASAGTPAHDAGGGSVAGSAVEAAVASPLDDAMAIESIGSRAAPTSLAKGQPSVVVSRLVSPSASSPASPNASSPASPGVSRPSRPLAPRPVPANATSGTAITPPPSRRSRATLLHPAPSA